MELKREAAAGTLESSDIMITVGPGDDGIRINLSSPVESYYGDSIRGAIREELMGLGVENARVEAVDHGALDCTIRARTITAARRAMNEAAHL